MNNIEIIQADAQHIELLIKARLDFFTELLGTQTAEKIAEVTVNMKEYFDVAIKDKTYVSFLAMDGDAIAGCGGVVFRQRPGGFINPTGWEGYIMSMYTAPQYRKMGIATQILTRLVDVAKKRGVLILELHATAEGEPVYRKYGFKPHIEPTLRLRTDG